MRVINFYSEDLKIDYLSLNLQFNNLSQIQKIADYLADTFGCKSTLLDQSTKLKKTLVESVKRNYLASFIVNSTKYWRGTTLCFKGNSAQLFYEDLKFKKLDWAVFDLDSTNLGRIDLCYDRELNSTDRDPHLFLENSCQTINEKNDKRHAKISEDGNILWIGKRSSSNYYRVYQKQNGLQFEPELKNQLVKSFQKFLMDNSFQQFEHNLSKHFYRQSFESLNLNSYYMNWLLHWYRQSSPKQNTIGLLSTYLKNDNKELTFNFLRFLSFLQSQTKKSYTRSFDDQVYYMIRFPLSDFIIYIGADHKSHYQRKKALQIFKDLEAFQIFKLQRFTLEDFDDFEFSSSVIIPYLKVKKNGRLWTVNVAIAKELYEYKYPFQMNEYFLTWKTIYQFQVKSQIITITAIDSLKKEFYIQEFLKQFSVSNKKTTQLKQMIIEAIYQQINNQLIQPQFKIIQKDGSIKKINKLQTQDISQIKVIYFYENIDYKTLF